MEINRETLPIDVLFVGAGPASLSGALHLANLIKAHNEARPGAPLQLSLAVIEKGKEVGAHILSGAVLDPKALKELVPDYDKKGAPLTAVTEDQVWFLMERRKLPAPVIPPPLRNHGHYIISLGQFVKWLAAQVEEAGVDIFPEFPGSELLYDGNRVVGVRTGDKGLDKRGEPKPNFEPGVNILTKVVVLGEGVRGSLTKKLVDRFRLDKGKNPQLYSVGIKELWEVPAGGLKAGTVIHTLGHPLDGRTFGGGFIYALTDTTLSLGLVVGLSYEDPRLDPHRQFQRFKTHPAVSALLKNGQLVRYGAKALPEGGYYSIPKLFVDGLVMVGDAAGFLNSQRLKGIHLAMKSGMLAAEAIFAGLLDESMGRRVNETMGQKFETLVRQSWMERELYQVRNFHQSFHHGLWFGMANGALQMVTAGRGLLDPIRAEPGHRRMKKLSEVRNPLSLVLSPWQKTSQGPRTKDQGPGTKDQGPGAIDKLTDLYYSRTSHEEDQPVHLHVSDPSICHDRCTTEYGNPCQYFCPANVYEMVEEDVSGAKRLHINASNCVHCKTCDVMDPYQIITWVPPEGGGGPDWGNM
jgi:electron-transferring-flavoprotein dehydrogenase